MPSFTHYRGVTYTKEHEVQENEIWAELHEKVKDLIEEAKKRGIYLCLCDEPCDNYTTKSLIKIIDGEWWYYDEQGNSSQTYHFPSHRSQKYANTMSKLDNRS